MAASSSFFDDSSVSDEEFNVYHGVDRRLYSRLVFGLRRDPAESTHLMALWLWLEDAVYEGSHRDLIARALLPLPGILLNDFANESILVIHCIESETFPFSPSNSTAFLTSKAPAPAPQIPMFRVLVNCNATLEYFDEMRLRVICGVADYADCVRPGFQGLHEGGDREKGGGEHRHW